MSHLKAEHLRIWQRPQQGFLGYDDSVRSQVSAVLSTPMWEWVLQRFGKRMSALGICVSEAGSQAWGGVEGAGCSRVLRVYPGARLRGHQ